MLAHARVDAADVVRVVELLPQHGRAHGFAGAVRHRAIPTGNGNQRRGLALAPADVTVRLDAHQQRILAAVTNVADLGEREIEKIHRTDFHVIKK